MGNYNLSISGLGTHSPHVADEEKTAGWAEVEARSLIARLLGAGHQVGEAILTHWPGTEHEVRENLLTGEKVATAAASEETPTTSTATEGGPAATLSTGETTTTAAPDAPAPASGEEPTA